MLTWTDRLSVGVEEIDRQHEAFVHLLNELHVAMMKGHARDVATPLLAKFHNLAKGHFATEERYFSQTQYPDRARHAALHQGCLRQVDECMSRLECGETAVAMDLLRIMREWLMRHMVEEDTRYTQWMNSHGIF